MITNKNDNIVQVAPNCFRKLELQHKNSFYYGFYKDEKCTLSYVGTYPTKITFHKNAIDRMWLNEAEQLHREDGPADESIWIIKPDDEENYHGYYLLNKKYSKEEFDLINKFSLLW
jgi:hypothetical protein